MTKTDYIDFIKNKLFELFPNVPECSYSFDECSDTHFIFIPSKSVFKNAEFTKFSAETAINFYEYGFGGTIAFISDINDMEYLEFQMFKNSYLITDDWIKRMIHNPILIDDFDFPNSNLVGLTMFANPLVSTSVDPEESYYALAA
jgi:hypothetical protein